MPVHVVEKLNRILRAERKLRAERGREPTVEEVARDVEMTPDEVEHIERSAQTPVSLEKPVGDDDESEFGHFLADDSTASRRAGGDRAPARGAARDPGSALGAGAPGARLATASTGSSRGRSTRSVARSM